MANWLWTWKQKWQHGSESCPRPGLEWKFQRGNVPQQVPDVTASFTLETLLVPVRNWALQGPPVSSQAMAFLCQYSTCRRNFWLYFNASREKFTRSICGDFPLFFFFFLKKVAPSWKRVFTETRLGSKWVYSSLNMTTKLEWDLQQTHEKQTQLHLSWHPCQALCD